MLLKTDDDKTDIVLERDSNNPPQEESSLNHSNSNDLQSKIRLFSCAKDQLPESRNQRLEAVATKTLARSPTQEEENPVKEFFEKVV